MNYDISDFIGVFDNALCAEECNGLINLYEKLNDLNLTQRRSDVDSPVEKDNTTVFPLIDTLHTNDIGVKIESNENVRRFIEASWQCYNVYLKKYGVLSSLNRHIFYDNIKIQKTEPTQGYHIWHCEHGSRLNGSRLLLVLAYLNDVEEGGETEFLYQSRRIKPKQGTIIICPSSFTHTHRGNPPLRDVKYVVNGWIEFCE